MTESYFDSSSHVVELSPSDFDNTLSWKLGSSKCNCCVILFYLPWCPYCKAVKNDWEKLGKVAKFFDVYAFNAEKNKKHMLQIKEELPDLIRGYPTIIVYKKGEPVEKIGEDEVSRSFSRLLSDIMRVCPN